ncbi:MAG: flagellar biosynthetic protein FliO [Myxococcales bacterium]|nr:flagellar biosynthetic protein FliO [Myxococcales bacterium]
MRAPLLLSLFTLTLALIAGPARAGASPFELRDQGDRVEIVARGWTAADPSAITITRERLELIVAGGLTSARQSYEDPTVRRVEVRGREPRVLSIKLRADHDRVAALGKLATVTQVGDDIVVVIPRAVPRPAPAPAPAATTTAAAPTAAAPTPTATTATPTAPAAGSAPATTAPAATAAAAATTTAAATATLPSTPAIAAPPARTRLGGAAGSATGARWWMLLAGLALVGGGATLLARRRQRAPVAASRIEVIDSRPLGGKARVVWLSAGDRELMVAVSPQHVRLLGQWRRNRDNALEAIEPSDGAAPPLARGSATRLKTVPASPAVSGILRLRDKPAPLADDIASDDPEADEQWARDILAATGGRR